MILKNILVQYYPKLISIPISLIIHSLLVRTLNIDEFALMSLISAIIIYLIGLSDLGLGNYYYRQALISSQNYFLVMIKLKLRLFIFILFILFILFDLGYFEKMHINLTLVLLIILLSLIQILGDSIEKMIRSISLFEILAKRGVIYNLILFLFVLILYELNYLNLNNFLIVLFISFIFKFIMEYNDLLKYNTYSIGKDSISFFKNKEVLPWILIFLANLIFTKLDLFMLNELSTNYDVAVYNATYTIYEKLEFFLLSISIVIYNFFAKEKKYEILDKIIFFITIISTAFILFGIILYPYLIDIIVGKKYVNAKDLFIIMLIATYFKFHTAIFINILLLEKKEKVVAIIIFYVLIINGIFNYYLIPRYGAIGATYITFFSDFINLLLSIYFIKKNKIYKISILYIFSLFSVFLILFLPDILKIVILLIAIILFILKFKENYTENMKILRGNL